MPKKMTSKKYESSKPHKFDYDKIERYDPNFNTGLNDAEVSARIQGGFVNGETEIKTKSVGRIIRDNSFTPFNLLNLLLAVLILCFGSIKNMLFLNIIFLNIIIGSFQEIKAKKTIDKLSLVSSPKATVIRNGQHVKLPVSEIVLDDILILKSGNQICCDCTIVNGSCEVNESLITGENDPLLKTEGNSMLSGSFVSSGSCCAKVEHIGLDNYASIISDNAKYVKKPNSDILKWVNIIVKIIGVVIIPVGVLMLYKELFVAHTPIDAAVTSTVAALIGMIPEGLILLISVVFAIGVIRLSAHKTLVQELYCIETLARVDTLCLDKTGTITEGKMQLDRIITTSNFNEDNIKTIISSLLKAQGEDTNPTFDALREHVKDISSDYKCMKAIPFSSARKWSGASFESQGTYILGAAEFVIKSGDYKSVFKQIDKYSNNGYRVLVLAYSDLVFENETLPPSVSPIALLILSDKIRPSARLTLEYFADQGVDIKVISGDNAKTVSIVAKKAGLENADSYIDASTLTTEKEVYDAAGKYTIFGRVTPQQKLMLVKALKKNGHTVAMTGDGVNDVLALKESDCSIAMASGSDAARTVSQLVLLDSDFSSLPLVLKEGRRSINNLQRSASLYLVKTIFSTLLAIFFVFSPTTYPFQPIQLTLISFVTIGSPSFFLALEPNSDRVVGKFIINVLTKALPSALTITFNIIILTVISYFIGLSYAELSTLCVIMTAYTGFLMLERVCSPLNTIRTLLFATMVFVFCIAFLFFKDFFGLIPINALLTIILVPLMFIAAFLMSSILQIMNKIIDKKFK